MKNDPGEGLLFVLFFRRVQLGSTVWISLPEAVQCPQGNQYFFWNLFILRTESWSIHQLTTALQDQFALGEEKVLTWPYMPQLDYKARLISVGKYKEVRTTNSHVTVLYVIEFLTVHACVFGHLAVRGGRNALGHRRRRMPRDYC